MELCLTVWVKNVSLSTYFDIMKVITKMDYNIHLILDAVKSYLALNNLILDENLTCYRCGHFPVPLHYDVIRKVCFDVDPTMNIARLLLCKQHVRVMDLPTHILIVNQNILT